MSNCEARSVHFDIRIYIYIYIYIHIYICTEMLEGIWYQSNITHVSSYETQIKYYYPSQNGS